MPTQTFDHLNAEKKDRVMAALLQEFSAHSLADAQVARIVSAAGIARGAFYKYFADLTDAYQTLYRVAMAAVHQGVPTAPQGPFDPQRYYQAVTAFLTHFTGSQYDELIQRHYGENESLLPARPVPTDLPAADWAAMILSHATIKAVMLRPDTQAAELARFQQALQLLAKEA
ncbi:TetR/AcrR family transcriptional regulator [Levilactobacillus yiduensis]|uniref:TetR/AcrR family transcriptional regulator n=1 Tax=Levilactobacillus yiduensis TaxID=2953880 RepID=UPI000EF2CEB3|nr:TetR/AcrR family transcriptional regulator [Levilactobacillus yiduensis]AYM01631.1 TetR/AcrR family transcriptional regulator [Levilactobacillus brevis]